VQYDARLEAEKNARAGEIMASGLALSHERVDKLKTLAGFLEVQMYERDADGKYYNIWVPDTKAIGAGEYTTFIDIERFNSGLLSQFRDTLADLAAETGGRVNKQEIRLPDGVEQRVIFEEKANWRGGNSLPSAGDAQGAEDSL